MWRVAGAVQAWPGVTELRVAGEWVLVFGSGRAAVWQPGRMQAPVLLRTGAAITAAAIDGAGTQVVVGDAAGDHLLAVTREPALSGGDAHVTRWALGPGFAAIAKGSLVTSGSGAFAFVGFDASGAHVVTATSTLVVRGDE